MVDPTVFVPSSDVKQRLRHRSKNEERRIDSSEVRSLESPHTEQRGDVLLHQQRTVTTGPRDRSVEHLRGQQRLLALRDHDVDALELAALRLVHRNRVRQLNVLIDLLLRDPTVVGVLAEAFAVSYRIVLTVSSKTSANFSSRNVGDLHFLPSNRCGQTKPS